MDDIIENHTAIFPENLWQFTYIQRKGTCGGPWFIAYRQDIAFKKYYCKCKKKKLQLKYTKQSKQKQ